LPEYAHSAVILGKIFRRYTRSDEMKLVHRSPSLQWCSRTDRFHRQAAQPNAEAAGGWYRRTCDFARTGICCRNQSTWSVKCGLRKASPCAGEGVGLEWRTVTIPEPSHNLHCTLDCYQRHTPDETFATLAQMVWAKSTRWLAVSKMPRQQRRKMYPRIHKGPVYAGTSMPVMRKRHTVFSMLMT